MKKAIGQTVRDLKRGVNKKVLKVPSIEQKVLDSTSNEPWGPHGSLLADIAQATRNYHEYQMIMSVIWKRINDTGKNWRHVYKALTVLEYLVAHGSERVIDDIREHAYQISTLSDFQYIDSSGKDQGNNVRKKSQSLVVLVNDKDRIQEARQKAAANRDKYRTSPAGGMYRPGSGSYGDRYDDDRSEGRYGSRDDDRNGYGREKEWSSRDDDRYGREGDRYGRDNEERYGRDSYRDDDHRGRSQSTDNYNYGSRSRSADRDRNPHEDDGQYSSRGSGAKADDQYQDGSSSVGKRLERKYSDPSFNAPPSYEDVVGAARSPHGERDGESSVPYAPKASSPVGASPSHVTATAAPPPLPASPPAAVQSVDQHTSNEIDGFDEFDPRGSFSAAPAASNGIAPSASAVEMDLLGSLSESFSSNSLALVPTGQPDVASEANPSASFNSGPTIADASTSSTNNNQPFDDPFGDGPFRAIPTSDSAPHEQQFSTAPNSFSANSSLALDVPQPHQNAATEFGGPFSEAAYMPSGPSGGPSNMHFQQESSPPSQDIDILADILPPSAPTSFANAQGGYPAAPSQPPSHGGFPPQTNQHELQSGLSSLGGPNGPQNSFQAQTGQPGNFPTQPGQPPFQGAYPLQSSGSVPQTGFPTQTMALTFPIQAGQASQMGFHPQTGSAQPNPPNPSFYGAYHSQPASAGPAPSYTVPPGSTASSMQPGFLSNSGPSHLGHQAPQLQSSSLANTVPITQASTVSSAIVPKPSSDKFETKSTVWTDTLSRGLVNLNISGSKTNPLNDIGVDFDAINRKEKRMEKPTTTTVTSTITMGKAMGSGSGVGRAGAGVLRPSPNPMVGSGMNFGVAGGPGGGMGMVGYGGSQHAGRGMGMGMGMGMNVPGAMGVGQGMNMGMSQGMNMGVGPGMNMGMGPGMNMQQPMGNPHGSTMPGGYNLMMGTGNYGQQPYGGGSYR